MVVVAISEPPTPRSWHTTGMPPSIRLQIVIVECLASPQSYSSQNRQFFLQWSAQSCAIWKMTKTKEMNTCYCLVGQRHFIYYTSLSLSHGWSSVEIGIGWHFKWLSIMMSDHLTDPHLAPRMCLGHPLDRREQPDQLNSRAHPTNPSAPRCCLETEVRYLQDEGHLATNPILKSNVKQFGNPFGSD